MENSEDKTKNVKLYPLYKMISFDLLFYYAIVFLLLTQVKNIEVADVLLSESLYPIFKFVLLIPMTAMIDKIGKRKSLIMANFSLVISILILIFAQNLTYVLISQFFSALGFIIKGICEINLLYDSIPQTEKRGSIFAKIDGKSTGYYYYVDAICSVLAGFLYVVNGYIPMILCLISCIVSTILCTKFEEVDNRGEQLGIKTYLGDIKYSFKYMLKSSRLRNLLLFGSIFSGLLAILVTLRSSLFKDIGVPEQYFGIVFAVLGIISGITTKNQFRFHEKFRNKTLTILAVPVTISCILLGLIVHCGFSFPTLITIVIAMYLIHYIMKGPFYILIRRYLNNFTTYGIRNKISSLYNMTESLARAAIALTASLLLRFTDTANVFIIIGCIATIAIVLLLDNMRKKVGLKPEEYKKKDIEFLELK